MDYDEEEYYEEEVIEEEVYEEDYDEDEPIPSHYFLQSGIYPMVSLVG